MQRTLGKAEDRRKCAAHATGSLLSLRWLILRFLDRVSIGIFHLHSVQDSVGVEIGNESFIDQLVSDQNNGVKIVVNGLARPRFLADLLQHSSDAVDNRLHDEVVLLLVADEKHQQLIDDLDEDGVVSVRKDLICIGKGVLSSGLSLEMMFILATLSSNPRSNFFWPSLELRSALLFCRLECCG